MEKKQLTPEEIYKKNQKKLRESTKKNIMKKKHALNVLPFSTSIK